MILTTQAGAEHFYRRRERIPLAAPRTYVVEAGSIARINHYYRVTASGNGIVVSIPQTGSLGRGLLVSQEWISDGDVITQIFNMTTKRLTIQKGEIVAWLIEL